MVLSDRCKKNLGLSCQNNILDKQRSNSHASNKTNRHQATDMRTTAEGV